MLARPQGKFMCTNWKPGASWAGTGNTPCTRSVQQVYIKEVSPNEAIGENIPDFNHSIEVKAPGGIEMGNGGMSSLELVLRGCISRCSNLLDVILQKKVVWGVVYKPD